MSVSNQKSVIIIVKGVVQGVGFRPFVYNLAIKHHLNGTVSNTGEGVIIELEGFPDAITQCVTQLQKHPPTLSRIDSFTLEEQERKHFSTFEIVESFSTSKTTSISPDTAVCEGCLEEMRDPHNRRYGYYLINCTHCGPRYSIIKTLPYDRASTSMDVFTMCPQCQAEYNDPTNRRFHAQPISCYACGPVLTLSDHEGKRIIHANSVMEKAAELLQNGSILAIKGLGGFHLMCDATNETAVATLRLRKKRPKKPLAVMFANVSHLKRYAHINEEESHFLTSKESPIVLLNKSSNTTLAPSISPDINTIGAMLAYTPLHHLLFDYITSPLVATSANRSGEPILRHAQEVWERLGDVIDYSVDFNRDIVNTVDDSIIQVIQNRHITLRLGRGYAPLTLVRNDYIPLKIVAVGGQQKNTIALAFEDKMILSPHIGDLHTIESMEYFVRSIESFSRFYDFKPDVIVCDKHPSYATTQWAKTQGIRLIEVQHHYAHALACMAEFGLKEEVLAFCFDGTGYGDDGTLWGGEVFRANTTRYERLGHIKPFRLLGGEKAVKEPKRVALALLFEVYTLDEIRTLNLPFLTCFKPDELTLHYMAWKKGLNAPLCSSMGRLFDAVASFCDILHQDGYEGEGGRRLEELYVPDWDMCFEYTIENGVIDLSTMIKEIVILGQLGKYNRIATSFITMLVAIIEDFSNNYPHLPIVLSGGVFQNKTLLDRCVTRLEAKGCSVYFQQRTPINDGGIALGQLYYGC